MRTLTPVEAAAKILGTAGSNPIKTFSVTFFKKGKKNGEGKNEQREMVAFLGSNVKAGLRGGPAAYNPADHGLIWTYEVPPGVTIEERPDRRRSIAVAGLIRLKIDREEFEVSGQPWA